MGYINLGAERFFSSIPTMDSERKGLFQSSLDWKPDQIDIFGHKITVDLPTGNFIISKDDINYSYYNLSLGISRKYDLQEQYMQQFYKKNYTNVNPKPHWFGNWQFSFEADIDEIWYNSYPEIQITTNIGLSGLFETDNLNFKRNVKKESIIKERLATYGIPKRTLNEIEWEFNMNDFFLRTIRGPFQIITGFYHPETLVDDISARIWGFNPITGTALYLSTDYSYNLQKGDHREVGFPLIVNKVSDALGHNIQLIPSPITPPYQEYRIIDGSGRELGLELKEELTYPDNLNPGGSVRKYLISKAIDKTKTSHNEINYKYNTQHLLEEITYPSEIGNHYMHYHYDNSNYPNILTAIENFLGDKIEFEYMEDPEDNDERLNPRLKIHKIIIPENILFEYEYDYPNSEVIVKISYDGKLDRTIKYNYIRDTHNTRKRYITSTTVEVKRGFFRDPTSGIVPLNPNNPRIYKNQIIYTNDGRYNVKKKIDPLNREIHFNYNDFNQIEKSWDIDNHWTKSTYNIPDNPSPSNPITFDLIKIEKENIIRTIDETLTSRPFVDNPIIIAKEYKYDKYNSGNSSYTLDHGIQSTHRVIEVKNERNKIWTYSYDDPGNHNPLSPTSVISPESIKIECTYYNQGQIHKYIDPEKNNHILEYYPQGLIKVYTDPNGETIEYEYYLGSNGLKRIIDQYSKITQFERRDDGKINKIIDFANDSVDYLYLKNGRLSKVILHRPAIPENPTDPHSPSRIKEYLNLETSFRYSALGSMVYFENPKGLGINYEYDETGRLFQWDYDIPNPIYKRYIYDNAGQLIEEIDRKKQCIIYTYHNSGQIKSIQFPNWKYDTNNIPGKLVEYRKYDYLHRPLVIVDSEILGKKEFAYDEAGNITIRRDPDNFELRFTYDDDDRLVSINDFDNKYELFLKLDVHNRPEYLTDSAELEASIKWDFKYEKPIAGGGKKVLNLFERSVDQIKLLSEYDYDKKNRLESIDHILNDTPPITKYSQSFKFRDDDSIESIINDDANEFLYDGIKQLIFSKINNLSYDYDKAGNRLYAENKTIVAIPQENKYDDLNLNRLKHDKKLPAHFEYDDNGNVDVTDYPNDPTNFYFDGANRLRIVKFDQNEIKYLYDEGGKLVKRETKDLRTGNTEVTSFHYLLTKPIIIKRDGNLFMLLTWDHRGRLLRVRWKDIIGGATFPHSLFPLYNGLGDIVRFIDDTGNVSISLRFDTWGKVNINNDINGLYEIFGYKGGIWDKLSGYTLFGNRWYDSITGRWLSPEPLELFNPSMHKELSNVYTYALNNPILYFDPSGLESKETPELTKENLKKGWGMNVQFTLAKKVQILGMGFGFSATISVLGFIGVDASVAYKFGGFGGKAGYEMFKNEFVAGLEGNLGPLGIGVGQGSKSGLSLEIIMKLLSVKVGTVLAYGADVDLVYDVINSEPKLRAAILMHIFKYYNEWYVPLPLLGREESKPPSSPP